MINNSKSAKIITYAIMIILVAACVIPFWLLIASSFTDENYIVQHGYSLLPKEFSLNAYRYLGTAAASIGRAYLMSILYAVIGVTANLILTVLFAYPLSRKDLPGRNGIAFFLFFTMLFNGGLVPTYMVYTNLLGLKDTIWGMIIPYLLMNPFYVIMMRTYINTSIPEEVMEASRVDGATETQTLVKITLPMCKPILATIGLMVLIGYWNNWTNGIYFLQQRSDLFGIQNYLNAVINQTVFLQNHASSSMAVGFKVPTQGVRMAIAVIAVIPLLVLYPFFQKYFVKGITLGSVKG
ncbi:putative aldouronate transport system permease protein [Lachnospiraceae bacterium NK3A20]|jgi:putative aldouronate transport system permease protein|nr:putative aldouronate transport system permease protein [Lachnospiraceae bacterium NK3A20]